MQSSPSSSCWDVFAEIRLTAICLSQNWLGTSREHSDNMSIIVIDSLQMNEVIRVEKAVIAVRKLDLPPKIRIVPLLFLNTVVG